MANEFTEDPTLIKEFLTESNELLQQLDQDMVALEARPSDTELLNRAFRALHTMKGTAGFLGLTAIVELSHHAEDVLNLLRKQLLALSPAIMDALLAVIDRLRGMLNDVRDGVQRDYQLAELLEQLKNIQHPPAESRPRIGEILVAREVITHTELHESLVESKASGRRLGEVLVEKNLASPEQVSQALTQQESGTATVSQTMRVDAHKLDSLIGLVGELVLERNRLVQLCRAIEEHHEEPGLNESIARLSFLTEELQVASLKTRMLPVDTVFRRFPRLVRDLARSLNKEVDLVVHGEETELDKAVVEMVTDPLVHLVRNALDHGIEPPQQREAAAKPRRGTLMLEASQQGDHILISVRDDGAGIDPQKIIAKARERGLLTADAAGMSKREVLELLFLPGFSTAEKVTDVSGRGVGMDVVRSNLKKLNGQVRLDSEPGFGCNVQLVLPLTLAMLRVLMVEAGRTKYAIPLTSVLEIVRIAGSDIHRANGQEIVQLRSEAVPVLRCRQVFGQDDGTEKESDELLRLVILSTGEKRYALAVDRMLGQEETVIKPLGAFLHHVQGMAGATINSQGQVVLVMDPATMAAMLGSKGCSKAVRC